MDGSMEERQEKIDPNETFMDAVRNSRSEFVRAINSGKWDTKLRTEAESMLIIFDQMKARLEIEEYQSDSLWKKKYFTLLDKWKSFKQVDESDFSL